MLKVIQLMTEYLAHPTKTLRSEALRYELMLKLVEVQSIFEIADKVQNEATDKLFVELMEQESDALLEILSALLKNRGYYLFYLATKETIMNDNQEGEIVYMDDTIYSENEFVKLKEHVKLITISDDKLQFHAPHEDNRYIITKADHPIPEKFLIGIPIKNMKIQLSEITHIGSKDKYLCFHCNLETL